jgi:hypothetical protein
VDIKYYFGVVATLLTIVAYIPYCYSIIRGKTKPNIITWLVLFVIGAISFFSYKELGAVNTLGFALANLVGPLVVFLLACVKNGMHEQMQDLYFLLISLLAIILWIATGEAFIGLLFNLIADLVGFVPTIVKAYKQPKSEDLLTWAMFSLGGIMALMALERYTLELLLYPLYIVVAEGIVFLLLLKASLMNEIVK